MADEWLSNEPRAKHDREKLPCGSAELDRYFREQTTQDIRRRIAFCLVAINDDGEVADFYTRAATSLALDLLSSEWAHKLPRCPVVPSVLLGRLAVATSHQGKRLGIALVADAAMRASRSEIAGHMMVVDAKDERAASFYANLGFERLSDNKFRLIMRL